MAVAVFDYPLWSARYPELVNAVGETAAGELFLDASIILSNTDSSPVVNTTTRLRLLNMLVAHLAVLFAPINGQASSTSVGRVSQASEGSVSVSLDMGPTTANSAWYMQTKYGAQFWQATAALRTMHYVPGPLQSRYTRYTPWH